LLFKKGDEDKWGRNRGWSRCRGHGHKIKEGQVRIFCRNRSYVKRGGALRVKKKKKVKLRAGPFPEGEVKRRGKPPRGNAGGLLVINIRGKEKERRGDPKGERGTLTQKTGK